jgi:hypothetical protein
MGVYGLSWYMNIVSVKWGIVSNNQRKIFLPVAYKTRPGYKNIYQPFFCMFTVPVNINETNLNFFLEGMKENFSQVELHLPFVYKGKLPSGITSTLRIRQEMKIDSYKKVRANYSENASRLIKKAEKTDILLKYDISPYEVTKAFANAKGADLKDIKPEDLKRLNTLFTSCIAHDAGFTVGCFQNNELIASAFFLQHDKRLIYLKGSVNETGKKIGAMYYLFDQVIKEKGNNFSILDFGGSNIKSVYDFYHKLGGKDVSYSRITTVPKGVARIVAGLKKIRRK